MENLNIKLLICAFCVICCFSSCNDELNALPGQSKMDGNLVVDQKSAVIALNGVYYKYALCGTDYYDVKSTGCALNYEVLPGNLAGVNEYYQGAYRLETHSASSLSGYNAEGLWRFYETVNAANAVIRQVSDLADNKFESNKKNEILGEAYAMRALAFYNLLKYFGYSWDINSPYGILLRTEQSLATNLPIERSSVKDCYDQILSDLDFAIKNAPVINDPYYVSQWFAKGLKARVLMMRGQGSDYQEAASICSDIINNGPFTLEENYEDIFHKNGLNSKEVIFGIQPKENQSDVFETYYYNETPEYLPTENFLALFKDDPRLGQMFKSYADGMIICKHIDPALMTFNDIEESQYQMRLTEIYLLRAEALARAGNLTEASALLKIVMSKAGITDYSAVDNAGTQEALLQQIFNEGIRNLSHECGLEHDMMLRFPESITLKFNPYYSDKQYNVFAIPSNEFKYNNKLTKEDQNPGYSID